MRPYYDDLFTCIPNTGIIGITVFSILLIFSVSATYCHFARRISLSQVFTLLAVLVLGAFALLRAVILRPAVPYDPGNPMHGGYPHILLDGIEAALLCGALPLISLSIIHVGEFFRRCDLRSRMLSAGWLATCLLGVVGIEFTRYIIRIVTRT